MYEYQYEYIKLKYVDKAKLCYTDADSFIGHIKPDDIYADLAKDVEKNFDRSSYEFNKLVIGLMKDELGGNKARNCSPRT